MSRCLAAIVAAIACAALILLAVPDRTKADAAGCQAALKEFNSAQDAVAAAVTPYSDCIADNNGREPCTRTFSALQVAQHNFEAAVAAYNEQCN